MGRRSRKRTVDAGPSSSEATTRAERDAARRERARKQTAAPVQKASRARPGRTSFDERPDPLWGSFPLTELVILAGIVLMVWGFVSGAGEEGNARIAAGLGIAALAGLELAVREHVTGFRSHTTLLAGAIGILAVVGLGLGVGLDTLGILLAAGLIAFAGSFFGLRELFKRRSGGLSFR